MKTVSSRFLLIGVTAVLLGSCQVKHDYPDLNTDGLTALLDVMDAVASLHPDLSRTTELLETMSESEQEKHFQEARKRNEASPELRRALDSMLQTSAYQIYFRRFSNIDPETIREIVVDLPYRRRPSPGGVGDLFYDLIRERDSVRTGISDFLAAADVDNVYRTAQLWVPESELELPEFLLFYDSNAGSFTAEGKPFLNLYGEQILPFSGQDQSALRLVEQTMAHELQHVLAEPFIAPPTSPSKWEYRWVDSLVRSLVGEGVANHCSPPTGFTKEIYEDRTVVAALVNRFNSGIAALSQDQMTEKQAQDWSRSNYFEIAEDLLRNHLRKSYSGEELDRKFAEHVQVRPDLEHALGWWMTSRISDHGRRRSVTVSLLRNPYSLFQLYSEALTEEQKDLRIDSTALNYLDTVREALEADK